MSERTLREELEELADMAARRTTTLGFLSGALRTLAARCKPEKPGEAVALPEVLERVKELLSGLRLAGGSETNLRAATRIANALSAIEAYRPEPQGEVVRATIERLEMWASAPGAFLFDSGDRAEGGSGLLAPASAPERLCGAQPDFSPPCLLPAGHSGFHRAHGSFWL